MNYRHIFHAGNPCDIVKHVMLTLVLKHLKQKPKGFSVLDTHAGTGFYDLNDSKAQKTKEAESGIKKLLCHPAIPELDEYYAVLKAMNPLWTGAGTENFRVYPGSPFFAFHALREQDRLIACERHPDDAKILRLQAPADPRVQIHFRDGYEALGALLPPVEKRGLVLIDPPYEQEDEFDKILRHVTDAHRRWSDGIYMIWYPVKDRPSIWKFHEGLANTGISKILCAEFIYGGEKTGAPALNGSGMIVINPPWKLEDELRTLFPALHKALETRCAENTIIHIGKE